MRNIADKSRREDRAYFLNSITFFSEIRTLYKIMLQIMVEPDRTQMTIEHGARTLHVG